MVYIVMGVSGAGKTMIGQKLAAELGLPFYDGDDFHPPENIAKMEAGQPLDDSDREPWLRILANKIREWNKQEGAVLACSALKKSYRKILKSKSAAENIRFIYLKGDPSLISKRLAGRAGHFMPKSLLESQFKALEEPQGAVTVSVDQQPGKIVRDIINKLDS